MSLVVSESAEPPWWAYLANVPMDRHDSAYRPLMRIFADPTASKSWGVYNPGSEGHQVANFFENFRLDKRHAWIGWLVNRLGLANGPVRAASWSYELEDRSTSLLCDVAIGFRDDKGSGVVVIEAKRTSEKLSKGISPKDDPIEAHYTKLKQFEEIGRKSQVLLVSKDALEQIPSRVRASRNLITWEEIAAVQRAIFWVASGQSPELRRALRLHQALLGIKLDDDVSGEFYPPDALTGQDVNRLLAGIDRYAHFVKLSQVKPPPDWLKDEPGRSDLIARERQIGEDRQRQYWRDATLEI